MYEAQRTSFQNHSELSITSSETNTSGYSRHELNDQHFPGSPQIRHSVSEYFNGIDEHNTTTRSWQGEIVEKKSSSKAIPNSLINSNKQKNIRTGGKWSSEEDQILRNAVVNLGARNWKWISKVAFQNRRSGVQCLHRWQKVLHPGLVKGTWSTDEDKVVIDLVQKYGINNIKWSGVAKQLPGRLGKQCRERWFNHLDPMLKKCAWSAEEDQILMKAQASLGNKWRAIAGLLEGRSENAVKNRWNQTMRRRAHYTKRFSLLKHEQQMAVADKFSLPRSNLMISHDSNKVCAKPDHFGRSLDPVSRNGRADLESSFSQAPACDLNGETHYDHLARLETASMPEKRPQNRNSVTDDLGTANAILPTGDFTEQASAPVSVKRHHAFTNDSDSYVRSDFEPAKRQKLQKLAWTKSSASSKPSVTSPAHKTWRQSAPDKILLPPNDENIQEIKLQEFVDDLDRFDSAADLLLFNNQKFTDASDFNSQASIISDKLPKLEDCQVDNKLDLINSMDSIDNPFLFFPKNDSTEFSMEFAGEGDNLLESFSPANIMPYIQSSEPFMNKLHISGEPQHSNATRDVFF